MEELQSTPPFAWYEDYFSGRAMPKVLKEMESVGSDFYTWMLEHRPDLYAKISDVETNEIESLWISRGDKDSFKGACRTWYNLLIEGRTEYLAWKAREREAAVLSGKQEGLFAKVGG